jgi:large subunit ribosomal protein L9
MEVILMEKLPNLGGLGDVVKVKAGFARNYLIPHAKARRATAQNLAEFELRRGDLEKAQTQALLLAQEHAAKLEGLMLQISRKSGVDGKLFGSVTNFDISELLEALGHQVPKAAIRMPQGPLKQIGDHDITLALHADVVVQVKVSVLGET